jgi:predicted RNase H-like nuclease (RuvC/YqgF family)
MSRFIPVDPEKWAAMVIAQSDLVRYKEICDELDAECTRLKDENARLRSFCTRTIIPNIELEKEVTRLKTEVEQLGYGLENLNVWHDEALDKTDNLKAEVERLTKAGDAMVSEWANGEEKDAKNFLKALVIWNAAKEGKQP